MIDNSKLVSSNHSQTPTLNLEKSLVKSTLGLAEVPSSLISSQNGSTSIAEPSSIISIFFNWIYELISGCLFGTKSDLQAQPLKHLLREGKDIFDIHSAIMEGYTARTQGKFKAAIAIKFNGKPFLLEKQMLDTKSVPNFYKNCLKNLEKNLQDEASKETFSGGTLHVRSFAVEKNGSKYELYRAEDSLEATLDKYNSASGGSNFEKLSASLLNQRLSNYLKDDLNLQKELKAFFLGNF